MAFAENESFPSAVLAHHYPQVPNHGDITKFRDWPDYTAISYRNKAASDGPRYKALGNSMAVNVMRWLGTQIARISEIN